MKKIYKNSTIDMLMPGLSDGINRLDAFVVVCGWSVHLSAHLRVLLFTSNRWVLSLCDANCTSPVFSWTPLAAELLRLHFSHLVPHENEKGEKAHRMFKILWMQH